MSYNCSKKIKISISHLGVLLKNMTYIDDYILRGYCQTQLISTMPGRGRFEMSNYV